MFADVVCSALLFVVIRCVCVVRYLSLFAVVGVNCLLLSLLIDDVCCFVGCCDCRRCDCVLCVVADICLFVVVVCCCWCMFVVVSCCWLFVDW